eukprot:366378-Chlamydomonas_euryale.AAC.3
MRSLREQLVQTSRCTGPENAGQVQMLHVCMAGCCTPGMGVARMDNAHCKRGRNCACVHSCCTAGADAACPHGCYTAGISAVHVHGCCTPGQGAAYAFQARALHMHSRKGCCICIPGQGAAYAFQARALHMQ